jgi:hypothetical protein
MPLDNLMEFAIDKREADGNAEPWCNTYQADFQEILPTTTVCKAVLAALVEAERKLHLNVVRFTGGLASVFRPLTTVPDPNPQPQDPTDIVPYTSFLFGARPVFGEQPMSRDHIMEVTRDVNFGRFGWLEFRGALLESEVRQSLGGMSEEDGFVLDGLVDTFNTDMKAIQTTHNLQWVKITQAQVSKVVTVVDNKVKTTRVYGPPVIANVTDFFLKGVRLDQSNHRYFSQQ